MNSRDESTVSGNMPDEFDRLRGNLDGLPDVVHTSPSTITVVPVLGVGGSRTFIVQTFRQRDQGDTTFVQVISSGGSLRLVLPPSITDAIARQRDALSTKSRVKAGKARAAADKAAGKVPGFMRGRRRRGKVS
jgi:hypothetical protein